MVNMEQRNGYTGFKRAIRRVVKHKEQMLDPNDTFGKLLGPEGNSLCVDLLKITLEMSGLAYTEAVDDTTAGLADLSALAFREAVVKQPDPAHAASESCGSGMGCSSEAESSVSSESGSDHVMLQSITAKPINLSVITSTGKTIGLLSDVSHRVEKVKEMIQDREGIPPDQQQLLHAERQLDDGKSLGHYGVCDDATFHLVLKLRGGCFAPGTPITMADRSTKPIEDVKPFDEIASMDWVNGVVKTAVVLEAFRRTVNEGVCDLRLSDGTDLTTTTCHPFWVHGKGWCVVDMAARSPHQEQNLKLSRLETGDRLASSCDFPGNNESLCVEEIVLRNLADGSAVVHNLRVGGTQAYFAGGVLVHNTSGESLFNTFNVSATLLAPRWDFDFRPVRDGARAFSRGGVRYKRPEGSVRKALAVPGLFPGDGDRWLAADDSPGTWPVAYHGTAAANTGPITKEDLKAGGTADGVPVVHGAAYGTGVYVSPLPEYALQYSPRAAVPGGGGGGGGGRRFRVIVQCRVRPGSYTEHLARPAPWGEVVPHIWVVKSPRDVRPYALCLYEEHEQ